MIQYAVENSCGTMINATKECLADVLDYEKTCKKWKAPYPEDFGQISIAVSLVKILKLKVIIYGAGKKGKGTFLWLKEQGIEADCFFDSYPKESTVFSKPVYTAAQYPYEKSNILVLYAIGNEYFPEIKKNLNEYGFNLIIATPDFKAYMPCLVYSDVYKNRDRILTSYDSLSDEKSRVSYIEYFRALLARDFYRYDELDFTEKYFCSDLFDVSAIKNYVCVGAYDGENVFRFIARNQTFENILVIEPDKRGLDTMDSNFSVLPDSMRGKIRFVGKFASDKTEGDKIAIDDIAPDFSLFSFDIEGGEMDALKGMAETIRCGRGIIALSAYHKIDDFPNFTEYITSLNHSYKFFVRKYCAGKISGAKPTNEIVLYAIPSEME